MGLVGFGGEPRGSSKLGFQALTQLSERPGVALLSNRIPQGSERTKSAGDFTPTDFRQLDSYFSVSCLW